jgi:hypothetical protein
MKKFVVLISLILFAFVALAQKGVVQSVTPDTLTAVETEYFVCGPFGNAWENLTIQALHTQLGGTSDGTGVLQGSVDGVSYVTIQDEAGFMKSYPNDSTTITSGAVYEWTIRKPAFNYYRYAATGTASDTTLVTVKYIYKE